MNQMDKNVPFATKAKKLYKAVPIRSAKKDPQKYQRYKDARWMTKTNTTSNSNDSKHKPQ